MQEGYVNVLWFTSCCTRHEKAEKVDKWLKYFSSVALSLTLTILCFCTFGHKFRIGALVLAFVAGADLGVGSYCLVVDEIVKDRRLVRTKPYQMELDDALALTDDDALARDMFARSSQNDGKSFYMSIIIATCRRECSLA
ncbi:g8280 [Coccomyxa elongata]